MTRRQQKGITSVEFAIVAALVFTVMFAVFEVARAYYVYAALDEVTRRGARLAAVCPVNDPAIPQMAIFNASGSGADSPLVAGLTPAHVVIDYLDGANSPVANPADAANFGRIRYVRARAVGFVHQFTVPFVTSLTSINMPELATVLPRESLGIPREGAITPC